jgi:hypothetical protein
MCLLLQSSAHRQSDRTAKKKLGLERAFIGIYSKFKHIIFCPMESSSSENRKAKYQFPENQRMGTLHCLRITGIDER